MTPKPPKLSEGMVELFEMADKCDLGVEEIGGFVDLEPHVGMNDEEVDFRGTRVELPGIARVARRENDACVWRIPAFDFDGLHKGMQLGIVVRLVGVDGDLPDAQGPFGSLEVSVFREWHIVAIVGEEV